MHDVNPESVYVVVVNPETVVHVADEESFHCKSYVFALVFDQDNTAPVVVMLLAPNPEGVEHPPPPPAVPIPTAYHAFITCVTWFEPAPNKSVAALIQAVRQLLYCDVEVR